MEKWAQHRERLLRLPSTGDIKTMRGPFFIPPPSCGEPDFWLWSPVLVITIMLIHSSFHRATDAIWPTNASRPGDAERCAAKPPDAGHCTMAQFDELTVLSSGSARVASREWKRESAPFHGFNTAVANWVVRRCGTAYYDTECNRKAYAMSLTINSFVCVCRSTSLNFIRLAGSTESFEWDAVKRNRTTVAKI